MDCQPPGWDFCRVAAALCETGYFHAHLFFQVDCAIILPEGGKHLYFYFCQLSNDYLAQVCAHRKIAWRNVYEQRLLAFTSWFAVSGLNSNELLVCCLSQEPVKIKVFDYFKAVRMTEYCEHGLWNYINLDNCD